MYIISFNLNLILIHLAKKALIALLVAKKMQILAKYSNFLNISLKKKNFDISRGNQHELTHY